MQYPGLTNFKSAIIDSDSFDTLAQGIEPAMNGHEPILASGNFAVVFKMLYNNKPHALKCFFRDIPDRAERQKKIVRYLQKNPSSYFIDYKFLENELWVDLNGKGFEFPVTWMEWVDAPTLGEKIAAYCKEENKTALRDLADKFAELALWILEKPFAHGDLKHDNILVQENHSLVMVDYDGIFIPEFNGFKSSESGTKSFQHPARNEITFNASIDDFSILIIYTSLVALSYKPWLFKSFNNGQNIIFDHNNFLNRDLINHLKDIEELEDKIEALEYSLNIENIHIENLDFLLSTSYYPNQYDAIIHQLEDNTRQNIAVINAINEDGDPKIFDQIKILQAESQKKIKDLKHSLKDKNIKLSKEWWLNLSEQWKEIFLSNIADNKGTSLEEQQTNKIYIHKTLRDCALLRTLKIESQFLLDLIPLRNLPNLREIKIQAPDIIDITPLSTLKNLKSLYIDCPNLDNSSLPFTSNSLTSLSVKSKKIKDVNWVENFKAMKQLTLEHCAITNISGLAGCSGLRKVNLAHNYISDISPLNKLKNLTRLSLKDNNILDVSPLKNANNLLSLDLRNNPRYDITPIEVLTDQIPRKGGKIYMDNDILKELQHFP